MSVLNKAIHRFNTIPIKIPSNDLFHRSRKNISKIYMETLFSYFLRKKNKVGRIMLPNIKLYYKTIVIKTAWYWHKTDT